jgi:hypothetical protein
VDIALFAPFDDPKIDVFCFANGELINFITASQVHAGHVAHLSAMASTLCIDTRLKRRDESLIYTAINLGFFVYCTMSMDF